MERVTRSELHEMVWQEPMSKLARKFGISDVGLAKIFKKYNIPRPPRGYWARKAAGYKVKQQLLPPGKEVEIVFDVESNLKQREILQVGLQAEKEISESLSDVEIAGKHPLALRAENAIATGKPGADGRFGLNRKTLPRINVSPATSERVVDFLSMLGHSCDVSDIRVRSGKDEGESLAFYRGDDVVRLLIEEGLENFEVEPTPEQKRQPSWTWNNVRTRPSGTLVFRLQSSQHISGRAKWTESGTTKAIDLVPKIVARMSGLFDGWKSDREMAVLQAKRREEEERTRAKREARERHLEGIEKVVKRRAKSLLRAGEWFQSFREVKAFIDACESRWKIAGDLDESQREWLAWAKSIADSLNPLNTGYPDPTIDGPFDKNRVPFGGPYPESREMPISPKLKDIKKLLPNSASSYGYRNW